MDVSVSGDTFTVPAGYRASVASMTNGSAVSEPVTTLGTANWQYNEGVFTVDAANTGTATAVWTVSQNGRKATVTLTLTGATDGATYERSVEVSGVTPIA